MNVENAIYLLFVLYCLLALFCLIMWYDIKEFKKGIF